jgi:hypothetical protein
VPFSRLASWHGGTPVPRGLRRAGRISVYPNLPGRAVSGPSGIDPDPGWNSGERSDSCPVGNSPRDIGSERPWGRSDLFRGGAWGVCVVGPGVSGRGTYPERSVGPNKVRGTGRGDPGISGPVGLGRLRAARNYSRSGSERWWMVWRAPRGKLSPGLRVGLALGPLGSTPRPGLGRSWYSLVSPRRRPFRSGTPGWWSVHRGIDHPRWTRWSPRRLGCGGGVASVARSVRGAPRVAPPVTVPPWSEVGDPRKPRESGACPARGE